MASPSSKNLLLLGLSTLALLIMVGVVMFNDLGLIYVALLVAISLPQYVILLRSTNGSEKKEQGFHGAFSGFEEGEQEDPSPDQSVVVGLEDEIVKKDHPIKVTVGDRWEKTGSRDYGRNVLLAEDDKDFQKVTHRLLVSLGLGVDLANNGKVAFEMAQEKPYDLIIMDMNMPIMGGVQATQLIRHAVGPNTSTPIVALTSHSDNLNRERCYDAGMNSFMQKACSLEEMIEELDLVFEEGE